MTVNNSNVNEAVTFTRTAQQTLQITTKGQGTIWVNGTKVSPGQSLTLVRLSEVTISVSPGVNYRFHSIEDRTTLPAKTLSNTAPYTFEIGKDIVICVVFEQ